MRPGDLKVKMDRVNRRFSRDIVLLDERFQGSKVALDLFEVDRISLGALVTMFKSIGLVSLLFPSLRRWSVW